MAWWLVMMRVWRKLRFGKKEVSSYFYMVRNHVNSNKRNIEYVSHTPKSLHKIDFTW
jgi:hypothetical protein